MHRGDIGSKQNKNQLLDTNTRVEGTREKGVGEAEEGQGGYTVVEGD